jgi:hypothetical protein
MTCPEINSMSRLVHEMYQPLVMQHKFVEEQLHLAATMWTAQMLKEPLQSAALDIALGAVC